MIKQKLVIYGALLAIGGSVASLPSAYAFDMGDMMSPGKWFGGNKDRYYDDYYYDRYSGPYGYGGPYGWGGGPYGYGPYGYPGYGGYGYPGYYPQQQQNNNQPPPPPLPQ